jgi:hypothetical protein
VQEQRHVSLVHVSILIQPAAREVPIVEGVAGTEVLATGRLLLRGAEPGRECSASHRSAATVSAVVFGPGPAIDRHRGATNACRPDVLR